MLLQLICKDNKWICARYLHCASGDGLIEAGLRVPEDRLQSAMEDWFRRKGHLKHGDYLLITKA